MREPGQLIEQLAAWMAAALLLGGCLIILAPFFAPLLWGAIIAYCSWGLYIRLTKALGGRRVTAALIMTLCALLCVVGPFTFAVMGLVGQADELKELVNKLSAGGGASLPTWVTTLPFAGERIQLFWNELMKGNVYADFMRSKLAAPVGQWLLTMATAAGAGLLQMVLSIFLAFFFYIGGNTALNWLLITIRRVAGERGPHLLQLAGGTIQGVVYGILGTALVQAILAGFAYWIAGVPAAGVLGFATFFLSVIPMGAALIWVPAAIWLFSQGATAWAIFIVLWGALIVGSVDNFIKPLLISRGAAMPFILVVLGVLGGALAFGFLGVFIGPTLLAVGYSVMHDWIAGNTVENAPTH